MLYRPNGQSSYDHMLYRPNGQSRPDHMLYRLNGQSSPDHMLLLYYVEEKEFQYPQVHPFSLSMSGLLSSCVFIVLLSGTNFLPWFGYTDERNIKVHDHQNDRLKLDTVGLCSYAPGCQNNLVKLIVLSCSIFSLNVFSEILISASEGAVMVSLVSGLSSPLVAAFWSLTVPLQL
ncbi:hypothetical protein Btru_078028 [Bulinus truncatus]|nr:hypothetical protein Btru_078028 [Bulinus truncatus]